MTVQDNSLHPRLEGAARKLGIELSAEQSSALIRYLEQLQKWNKTYNLTALRDTDKMLVQHLFDSMAVISPLKLHLETMGAIAKGQQLIDVGSGGGLPGVVMAILMPDHHVHCVDAVDKKMAFVRQVSKNLKCPNLHAHHARIEEMPLFNAAIVISRAFASLNDFATWAGRHVARNGTLVAMKGRIPEDEIQNLHENTAWKVTAIEPLYVPELDAQRCLIWMSRKEIQ